VEAASVRLRLDHALITASSRLVFTVWLEAVAVNQRPRKEEQEVKIRLCELFSWATDASAINGELAGKLAEKARKK
jgi:hypothetical protein